MGLRITGITATTRMCFILLYIVTLRSHAYQILRAGGLDPDHIITFMYNDVPFDDQNPFSGKLYNHPGDQVPNVYEGVTIDYSKDQVNAETILKVCRLC